MHESIRLGVVRGITIGMHWSVLAIAALLTWGLAGGYLPTVAPGYRAGEYWLVAGAAVVVFFGSLLGHELGHSLVALHRGVEVDRITLWLFGGVARLRGDPPDPRAEFEIAAAGPGVSLAAAAAGGVRVRDVMTPSPITVRADAAVAGVLEETFLRHHCSAFPVVDGAGWVVGLLTLRQVREVAPAERAHRTAAQIAHPVERVTCVGPDEPLVRVLGDSAPDGAAGGRMLVLDHDRLVGIVSPNDVHRAIRDAVA
ncbi:MAG: CBS domain-containing protein [Actinomycetota bacterium]